MQKGVPSTDMLEEVEEKAAHMVLHVTERKDLGISTLDVLPDI